MVDTILRRLRGGPMNMMKVRMLTSRVGPGIWQDVGQVYDLPGDEARLLIQAGQAEKAPTKPERNLEAEAAAYRSRRVAE